MTELLAPAGSLEKLKIAISYGADAVYLAGQSFGLRTAAGNFTTDELSQAVSFARDHQAKIYVAVNSVMHDQDLIKLPKFIKEIDTLGVDALIVSDLGALSLIRKHSNLPIHLSTQASCTNGLAAKLWKDFGVSRIVLGRECSLEDAARIRSKAGIEVEIFVHGAMCISFSGNCLISNYCAGRDSNRGGCAQNCRFLYRNDQTGEEGFFLSSKDLNAIELIPRIKQLGIDSIKIEGRMKSHLYVGSCTKSYRQVLDDSSQIDLAIKELNKFSHRDYFNGSLLAPAGTDSVFNDRESSKKEYVAVGIVVEVIPNSHLVLEVRSAFNMGDTLEFLPFVGEAQNVVVEEMSDLMGGACNRTKPGILVRLPFVDGIEPLNLVRMKL